MTIVLSDPNKHFSIEEKRDACDRVRFAFARFLNDVANIKIHVERNWHEHEFEAVCIIIMTMNNGTSKTLSQAARTLAKAVSQATEMVEMDISRLHGKPSWSLAESFSA